MKESMAHGKFDGPALKLHAEDIQKLRKIGVHWRVDGEGPSVVLVWLQGHINSHTPDQCKVELKDGNFVVTINKCQNIPGGNTWITTGLYVMVIGEVDSTDGSINAVKIADLTTNNTNTIHKQTWMMEVTEAKAVVTENPHLFFP
ncbi:hypothetical protein Pcinc_035344 [Petrolisthes cinctipes]|uniref:RecQ-mediated genome instability protein 2 n=1 Tax=Petrolisthes cinctipes TaxID=88211 RepID=A0AAE1ENE7_PETCI|nr:hypothetical protein Pcinc_035344 [Petrolisthes cinctipes]